MEVQEKHSQKREDLGKRIVELKDKGFYGNTLFPDHKITRKVLKFP